MRRAEGRLTDKVYSVFRPISKCEDAKVAAPHEMPPILRPMWLDGADFLPSDKDVTIVCRPQRHRDKYIRGCPR